MPPNEDLARELADHNLQLAIPGNAQLVSETIDKACHFIRAAPDLERVVRQCVHEILLLKAPDDWVDVSHSEPRWKTTIFISVPLSSTVRGLRVAEAIVHEAMHLNLTFFEDSMQLTKATKLLYSPWRTDPRLASGVLHGLYVFACIHRLFEHVLRDEVLNDREQQHVVQRLTDIRVQIASIDRRSLLECLTPVGSELMASLFEVFDAPLL